MRIHVSNATPTDLERLKHQLAVAKAQTLHYSVAGHMKALEEYVEAIWEVGRSTDSHVLDMWGKLQEREDKGLYMDNWKLSPQGHNLLYESLVELIDEQEPDLGVSSLAVHGPTLEELLSNPQHPFYQRPSLQKPSPSPLKLPSRADPEQVPPEPLPMPRVFVSEELKSLTKLPGKLGLTFLPSKGPVKGISVSVVKPGSTAEDAGICKGDILLELMGTPIMDQRDYEATWKRRNPMVASFISLKVLRDSQLLDLDVLVGAEGYSAEQIRRIADLPKPAPTESKVSGIERAERLFKATIEAKKKRQILRKSQ